MDTKTTVKPDNVNAFRRRRNAQIKWMMLFVLVAVVAFLYLMHTPKKQKAVLGGGKRPPSTNVKQKQPVDLPNDNDGNEDVFMTTTDSDYYDMFSTTFDNWQDMYGRPHYRAWDYEPETTTESQYGDDDIDDDQDKEKEEKEEEGKTETKITKPQPVSVAEQIPKPDTVVTKPVLISKILPDAKDDETKIDIYKVTEPTKVVNIDFLTDYTNPCFVYGKTDIRCFPSFFIIGMPHSGTTDIYQRLSEHPHIIKTEKNSPEWWIQSQSIPETKKATLETYLGHFSGASNDLKSRADDEAKKGQNSHDAVIFENNPNLFWKGSLDEKGEFKTPANIKHVLPNSKMILFVRDPIERLYSEYMHFFPKGTQQTFHEFVKKSVEAFNECKKSQSEAKCVHRDLEDDKNPHIEIGLYSILYEEWLKYVSQSHIFVVRVEDYGKDTAKWLKVILGFLQLPYVTEEVIKNMADMKTDGSKSSESPKILDNTKTILTEFYQPYNKKFAELLRDKKFDYSSKQ